MRLVLAALSLTLAAGAASAQAFEPTDGWELYRRLTPETTANCADRNCWPRDGGMFETTTKGDFSGNTAIAGVDGDRFYYTVVGCGPDKRGCKALAMTYFAARTMNPAARPAAPAIARWNAANPACRITTVGSLFGPSVTVPLKASTKLADIEAARRALLECGPRYLAIL